MAMQLLVNHGKSFYSKKRIRRKGGYGGIALQAMKRTRIFHFYKYDLILLNMQRECARISDYQFLPIKYVDNLSHV